jgi:hypothetical protein
MRNGMSRVYDRAQRGDRYNTRVAIPNDTHPDAHRVQISLLRRMSVDRRGQMGSMLSNQGRWRTRQAIARASPELSEQEREWFLIELAYGRVIADRVREYQRTRAHADAR